MAACRRRDVTAAADDKVSICAKFTTALTGALSRFHTSTLVFVPFRLKYSIVGNVSGPSFSPVDDVREAPAISTQWAVLPVKTWVTNFTAHCKDVGRCRVF
ncbi:hypothetical protein LSAT2_011852, partial [Lamellibrachia satsuma]